MTNPSTRPSDQPTDAEVFICPVCETVCDQELCPTCRPTVDVNISDAGSGA